MSDHSPPLSPPSPSEHLVSRGSSAAGQAFLGGVIAAGLGLGVLAVAVLLLWIVSPYPDNGPGRALHVAADLWLLAHGAELVRAETSSGAAAPIGVTPLLISVWPCWLLYRAARGALEPPRLEPPAGAADVDVAGAVDAVAAWRGLAPRAALGWVTGGYLLVGMAAVAYAAEAGPLRVAPLSAVLWLPLVSVSVAAVGVWAGGRRLRVPLPAVAYRLVEPVRERLPRLRSLLRRVPGAARWEVRRLRRRPGAECWPSRACRAAALRAAAGATLALLGGGAVLVVVSLIGHAHAVQQTFGELSDAWTGRFAVLLLALVLLPNAMVWAAAYGLGPGFTVGAGSVVGPLGVSARPLLPDFPLLAALPEPSARGGPLVWSLAGLLPLAAGLSVACFVGAAATRRRPAWHWHETALAAALAALGCGIGTALLAAFAGGPLGSRALAHFGPSWWLTGAAAFVWAALIGVPGALVLRGWRLWRLWRLLRRGAPESTPGGDAPAAPALIPSAPAVARPAAVPTAFVAAPPGPECVDVPEADEPFAEAATADTGRPRSALDALFDAQLEIEADGEIDAGPEVGADVGTVTHAGAVPDVDTVTHVDAAADAAADADGAAESAAGAGAGAGAGGGGGVESGAGVVEPDGALGKGVLGDGAALAGEEDDTEEGLPRRRRWWERRRDIYGDDDEF
ncbi:DUF6350 family protein [Streptomyces sp. LX-29]|uniref:cell division protein PerM n=1 Tax=Streptomyces sp. LX-29 TaxID=2900152 RepID=UPI00240E4D14|nr:DUF6350 family protein [Streptomyces sp. LX-29]WFB11730.1 DUF6350 family protein [Streptomyces sp. LX-29]